MEEQSFIYFDNSATSGKKPQVVIDAIVRALTSMSVNAGRGVYPSAIEAACKVFETRQKAADFFGASDVDRVIFCHNCTDALNQAIFGSVVEGSHVVTTVMEHNSVLRPLFELERRKKISLTVLAPLGHSISCEQVFDAMKQNTRLVAINHVSNVTGAVNPIRQIGRMVRSQNALFLCDCAQSGGYLDIDMQDFCIDIACFAGHKGLHNAMSLGLLIFNQRVNLMPSRFGGTGTQSESVLQPNEYPECMESGTLPLPSILGLNAAIDYTIQHKEHMRGVVTRLTRQAYEGLINVPHVHVYSPPDSCSGVVSFNIGSLLSTDVSTILSNEYGICTRSGLHCAPLMHTHLGTLERGAVRVSVSPDNTQKEVDFLIEAVKEIAN